MCGISGFLHLNGAPADPDCLRAMSDSLRHRGPDDQGLRLFSLRRGASVEWKEGAPPPGQADFEGALGFNRLSILDLSLMGHQPMSNASGDILLAYNGEVYNAFDYKPELEAKGYRFRSRTDTEVILYLYEEYGLEGMLERLNGMFVICLVDLRQHLLVFARDPFGIKPFYWAQTGSTVLFASEVKAFLKHPAFTPELDEERLDEFLAFGFCMGEGHMLRGVRQLPPGHLLEIRDNGPVLRRYADLPRRGEPFRGSLGEAAEALSEHLKTSVRSQLLSDVKIGCQLSGGIDSSLVTRYAQQQNQGSFEAFSVVLENEALSEACWIEEATTRCGVQSHRFLLPTDDLFEHFRESTWHTDQPLHTPGTAGINLLARQSKPHVSVFLSGEGSDEQIGGYPRYYDELYTSTVERATRGIPGLGGWIRTKRQGDLQLGPATFVKATLSAAPAVFSSLRPAWSQEQVMAPRVDLFLNSGSDTVERCTRYDMQTYLVDLLIRQDKVTMAHSIENRVPFLDRNLAAFVRSLPAHYLVALKPFRRPRRMHGTKIVLKEVAKQHFGDRFTYRTKLGFPLPLADWFESSNGQACMEDCILPGLRQRSWLRTELIDRLWAHPHSAPEKVRYNLYWTLLSLELFAQQFLDQRAR